MKKTIWVMIAVIAVVIGMVYAGQTLKKRTGGAYKLAEQMKSQGLNYEKMNVSQSTSMYQEIALQGSNLLVKINHYGNGLFLKQVKDNLTKDKKAKNATEPIYAAGSYIIVVYQEPEKGMVKSILLKFFPVVEEY